MDPNACRAKIIEKANLALALAGAMATPPTDHQLIRSAELSVELAEAVHDLDGWLRAGGFLPDVWLPEIQRARMEQAERAVHPSNWVPSEKDDALLQAQFEQQLLLAWVIQNYTTDGVMRVPYTDLEALDGQVVERTDDHYKHEITFTLADRPKPNLTIVEAPNGTD